jgi:DNA-binding GntR family transcriptional regulator
VHLAEKLGVSRTPLREALNRLSTEGALTSEPRIGYFVRPLTLHEFKQIYGIRPLLDPEALRLAGIPDARTLERLARLNEALRKARGKAAVDIDDEWHLALIAACPNRVLIELIENIILRTKRYELALLQESLNVDRATGEHAAILGALGAGDLARACELLKRNMESGYAPIAQWLERREKTNKTVTKLRSVG